jgi:hypothetical protein
MPMPTGVPMSVSVVKNSVEPGVRVKRAHACVRASISCSAADCACTRSAMSMNASPVIAVAAMPAASTTITGT